MVYIPWIDSKKIGDNGYWLDLILSYNCWVHDSVHNPCFKKIRCGLPNNGINIDGIIDMQLDFWLIIFSGHRYEPRPN